MAHSHWLEIETHGKSLNQEYPGLLPPSPPHPRCAVRVPEVTHSFGPATALPPLPSTLSLAVGGCGHRAQREAAATNDARGTTLGRHYGAGGTLGGHREPGAAKGALKMGRASFWAAPAGAGRGAVPDSLSQPGHSIRGPPLAQPWFPRDRSRTIPASTPPTGTGAALGFGWALGLVLSPSPSAPPRWAGVSSHRRGICLFLFFLKQPGLSFGSCWPSSKMIRKTDCLERVSLLRHPDLRTGMLCGARPSVYKPRELVLRGFGENITASVARIWL